MCPVSAFYLFVIVIVVLFVAQCYKKLYERANMSIEAFSEVLEGASRNDTFLAKSLTGFFKGRKIMVSYSTGDNDNNSSNPCVELRCPVPKEKLFVLSYPRPTQNTFLMGNKVYYNRAISFLKKGDWLWNNIGVYSKQECLEILEELSRAAEIVEKNAGRVPGK
ncbi:MAG: hypothetical protein WC695_11505 [Candidatus Omnitrophota bacterium]